jgi:Protein of unknown function (DUF2795)
MSINYLELIDGMELPATKPEIVAFALDNGASEEALEAFEALPHDEYKTIAALNRDLGLIEQLPGGNSNLFSSSQSA